MEETDVGDEARNRPECALRYFVGGRAGGRSIERERDRDLRLRIEERTKKEDT